MFYGGLAGLALAKQALSRLALCTITLPATMRTHDNTFPRRQRHRFSPCRIYPVEATFVELGARQLCVEFWSPAQRGL